MSVSGCDPLVYVVEDDEALRDSLAWLLTSAGYRVAAYPTAEGFLANYAPGAASCLVLDVWLPGISGLELQHELRQTDRTVPVIFITGDANQRTRTEALNNGRTYFLDKPFLDERLLVLLEKVVARALS
jgi:FixJ family two-component response regulator